MRPEDDVRGDFDDDAQAPPPPPSLEDLEDALNWPYRPVSANPFVHAQDDNAYKPGAGAMMMRRAPEPSASRGEPARRVSRSATPPRPRPPVERRPASRPRRKRGRVGCLLRGIALGLIALIVLIFVGTAAASIGYIRIADELPGPDELQNRAASFQSTLIYARNGELLYELLDPHGGRRIKVPLDQISPLLIRATIATEDRDFYEHPGFDPIAITRAIWQNIREGEAVSGASTITQQLARALLLSDEERAQRTLSRKIKEIVLAAELTRRYSKDQILEFYLNEIYYGNLAYGIQAAAQTYFQKDAKDLTLAEASLLAGLPQAPAIYDPFTNPDAALGRQEQVLALMAENGDISQAEAEAAAQEMRNRIPTLRPPRIDARAPHFVNYVRQVLEEQFGAQEIYRSGLRVKTSLDLRLQTLAEEVVRAHVDALAERHVTNGALVAIDPHTGEILAMVGSKDFSDPSIDGQVNVALRPRQPGSAIKPLTYLKAFEMGWTPATLLWDLPTTFPAFPEPYRPKNYDGKFHGPQSLRSALANSYNIPAVKALQFIGIDNLKEIAARLGITTLTRPDYGLSLTLGGGEVTLLELTGAYAALANQGVRIPPTPILEITNSEGQVLWRHEPQGEQVLRPQHAYLMTGILSDNAARAPAFGEHSPLLLSRPAAAKTGTTNDTRDNWTVGYTPELVAGVWVGNSDNTPMANVSGITGAAPIWHDFMEGALAGRAPVEFAVPEGVVEMEVCADNGAQPNACPQRKKEVFAADQPPLGPEHDWWVACPQQPDRRFIVVEKVLDEDGRNWLAQWAQENNIPLGKEEDCNVAPPQAAIFWPGEGQTVDGKIEIIGMAKSDRFANYFVDYGVSFDPQGWGRVEGPVDHPVENGVLARWDTRDLPDGQYTLRLVVTDQLGNQAEARAHVLVVHPTAEPTLPPTETPTPLPTPTPPLPTPTLPPVITETPLPPPTAPSLLPTPTPLPP